MALQPAKVWAAERVQGFPVRWQSRLIGAWHRDGGGREDLGAPDWIARQERAAEANRELSRIAGSLEALRMPLDASDEQVCAHAEQQAERCTQLAGVFHQPAALRAAMARVCEGQGVAAPVLRQDREPEPDHMPAIRRMIDPLWWRRALRKAHAKHVEAAAIALGYVNKGRDCYVSNESLTRRQQQNARNAEALENTIATNEAGQEFTLAELAATGTANKAIRRAELMTRIAGFERIAVDLRHDGLFFTITCPSRMHKWATVKGSKRVRENRRYDGTTPREAQAYLAKVWARIRAALKRAGLGVYGFRIAEPNHDGTPHWHLLVFHEAGRLEDLREIVSRYALADSPNEPGADRHRVDFKPIDRSRGSAAGYIAKYVAKNIDGYSLERDLYGNDALETSARVEAWAATWGIRQFQQVGGPPVGVWRELRRVEAMPAGVPDYMREAHEAANRAQVLEGRDNQSVDWAKYVRAQGGVFCGRLYRVRVAKREQEGRGRYGEEKPDAPCGVETWVREFYTPAHMAHMQGARASRLVHWFGESRRHAWALRPMTEQEKETRKKKNAEPAEPVAPWTCVNNCTPAASRRASDEAEELRRAQALEDHEDREHARAAFLVCVVLKWIINNPRRGKNGTERTGASPGETGRSAGQVAGRADAARSGA